MDISYDDGKNNFYVDEIEAMFEEAHRTRVKKYSRCSVRKID